MNIINTLTSNNGDIVIIYTISHCGCFYVYGTDRYCGKKTPEPIDILNDPESEAEGFNYTAQNYDEAYKEAFKFIMYKKSEEKQVVTPPDENGLIHKIYTSYSEKSEITFIMEDIIVESEDSGYETISTEVVGFVYGEIKDDDIREYCGKTKVVYNEYKMKLIDFRKFINDKATEFLDDTSEEPDLIMDGFELSHCGKTVKIEYGSKEFIAIDEMLKRCIECD